MDHRRPLFLRIWGLIALIVGAVWMTASLLLLGQYGWGEPRLQALLVRVTILTAVFLLAGSVLASLTAGRLARRLSALQERVREQSVRGEALIQLLPMAVMTLDRDLRIRKANPAAGMLLGFEESALEGQSLFELMQPATRSDWMARLARIEEIGLALGPLDLVARGGRRLHVEATLDVERDPGNRIHGFTAMLKDQTERLESEQRLTRNLAFHRRLFQSARLGMMVTNP